MFVVFLTLFDRFRTMFITHAALELEADLCAAFAARKAELLQRADQYDKEGLHTVAEHLRRSAESLSPDNALSKAPPTAHIQNDGVNARAAEPTAPAIPETPNPREITETDRSEVNRKKNRKS